MKGHEQDIPLSVCVIYISINKSKIVRIYAFFLHAWRLSGSPVKLVQNVGFFWAQ